MLATEVERGDARVPEAHEMRLVSRGAALVRLVAVLEQVTGHEPSLASCRPANIRGPP